MSESEASLKLALYLISNHLVEKKVFVAIDGAQVSTNDILHFDIKSFLFMNGCIKDVEAPGQDDKVSGFQFTVI